MEEEKNKKQEDPAPGIQPEQIPPAEAEGQAHGENDIVTREDIDFKNRIPLEDLHAATEQIKSELGKVIVGQHQFVELLIVALLADGHVLIEGVPGIAKTITAKLFAKTLDTGFSRIQFTPDLMPSDVLGTLCAQYEKQHL